MKFTKMQGIGNDYVYVNCFQEEVADPESLAQKISNRHFGIGSDGLILIKPSNIADCMMDMYNADGSRGRMCGNGIRCVGKYVYDHGLVNQEIITVETLSGIKTLQLEVHEGLVSAVTVDMGEPELLAKGQGFFEEIELADGSHFQMIPISMGNPHTVLFVDDVSRINIAEIGPKFENHPRFPHRTNTEFVQLIDENRVRMRVWERGSGETLACGTGACAVAAAAHLAGHSGRETYVELLGGELLIIWDEKTNHIMMKGPAAEVFQGEILL